MPELHKDVQQLLRPGYVVHPSGSGAYVIRDPSGNDVRNKVGAVYHFTDESGWRGSVYRRQVIKVLTDLGIIKPPRKRRTNTSADHKTAPKSPAKTGLALAQETLRDPTATPRERRLAREHIKLMENHQKVRELASKLGKRLTELNETLDRVSSQNQRQ